MFDKFHNKTPVRCSTSLVGGTNDDRKRTFTDQAAFLYTIQTRRPDHFVQAGAETEEMNLRGSLRSSLPVIPRT